MSCPSTNRARPYRFACTLLTLTGFLASAEVASAAVAVPTNFISETIVGSLSEPLGIAVLPDGRALFTEQRTGKVRMIVNGHLAATDPILTVPSLNAAGLERGLQGIAVDPGWPSRPYLYFHYNRLPDKIRIVRYTASGDLNNPAGENLTLSSALILIDDIPDAAHNHNGGTLRFGPDQYLYVSIGEDAVACAAQDSTLLQGNVLRLDVSNLPASGGPVPRDMLTPAVPALNTTDPNAKLVYAYGLRNPWRFQIDSETGLVYLGDVGDDTYEELDEIGPGENLGWPFREGYALHGDGNCTEPGGSGASRYTPPITSVAHSTGSVAILCAAVYRPKTSGSANWPTAYFGDVFFSDYSAGYLRRLEKINGTWSPAAAVPGQPTSTEWATGITYPSDFTLGSDGSLWFVSHFNSTGTGSTGSIQRIRYIGPTVSVPGPRPTALRLRSVPNPFGKSSRFFLTLPRAVDRVRLLVFDARGRRVRSLFDQAASAGEMSVVWDGKDDRGAEVSSGIYFLRAEAGELRDALRVQRLE